MAIKFHHCCTTPFRAGSTFDRTLLVFGSRLFLGCPKRVQGRKPSEHPAKNYSRGARLYNNVLIPTSSQIGANKKYTPTLEGHPPRRRRLDGGLSLCSKSHASNRTNSMVGVQVIVSKACSSLEEPDEETRGVLL